MSNEKTIYELSLHESKIVTDTKTYVLDVTRVPGGWIYGTFMAYQGVSTYTTVFVPFHKE